MVPSLSSKRQQAIIKMVLKRIPLQFTLKACGIRVLAVIRKKNSLTIMFCIIQSDASVCVYAQTKDSCDLTHFQSVFCDTSSKEATLNI